MTVAIATYNRGNYLKENLEVLLPQCVRHSEVIKVVISDNASEDNTGDLIMRYMLDYPGLIYYNRNKENLGLQGNFSKAIELSHSKYVYLMGDDDILSPNFLDVIIPYLITDEEYGIIHWGRLVGDADCNNNKIQDPIFDAVVGIYEVGDFIKRTLSSTNFLSSCLFNKKCWELGEICEDKELSGYGYYARFLNGAVELNMKCIYYYFPLVIMRNPSRVWAKNWPIYFWCELFGIFKNLDRRIPGVYDLWVQRSKDKTFYNRNQELLAIYKDTTYYQPYLNIINESLSRKERVLLILIMHKPGVRFIERVYHIFIYIVFRLFYS